MSAKKNNYLLYLVATTFFMETLDSTVIATALPMMALDFKVFAVDVGVGITAYLLTLAVMIPISGWLADRFGARRIFTLAIAIFTGASILCGISESLNFFIFSRVLQGVGGALMVPVGRIIVLKNTPKEEIIPAIGLITWPALIGPVVGPAIGGLFTTYASWHWIFFINVPIGIIGIILSLILIKGTDEVKKSPLDIKGFFLSGIALSSLIYSIELCRHIREDMQYILGFLVLGLVVGFLAIRHFRRAEHPMIDLSLLKIPTFESTLIAGNLFRIALHSTPFLMPLYLQLGLGIDPFQAGLIVMSIFIGNLAMKAVTTPILNKYGFKKVMTINGIAIIFSLMSCAFITASMPIVLVLIILFVNGLVRSMQFTSINTLGLADVPHHKMGSASSLASTGTQLSMALGIAVGSLALSLATMINQGNPNEPSIVDFRLSFLLVLVLPIWGLYRQRLMSHDAGDDIRKKNKPQ
ncbi:MULTISPECIES: DHA2 family efflux MFS transporter permease subunit [unclassified Polynucleobacter]|uniref:DHA2 family efflux MFS transporter permease subunit n=1 Tax=unclassified Polynucleobacter TaxID=2640945 RepID=UPI002492DCA1|nr:MULTISPECIES: DHA2 family efflux MFS transporter permease subunit [unclassified Polynucleobacter]